MPVLLSRRGPYELTRKITTVKSFYDTKKEEKNTTQYFDNILVRFKRVYIIRRLGIPSSLPLHTSRRYATTDIFARSFPYFFPWKLDGIIPIRLSYPFRVRCVIRRRLRYCRFVLIIVYVHRSLRPRRSSFGSRLNVHDCQ